MFLRCITWAEPLIQFIAADACDSNFFPLHILVCRLTQFHDEMSNGVSSLEVSFTTLPGARRPLSALKTDDCFKLERDVDLCLTISNISRRLLNRELCILLTRRGSSEPASNVKFQPVREPGGFSQPPFLLRRPSHLKWLESVHDEARGSHYRVPGVEKTGSLELVFRSLSTSSHQQGWALMLEFLGENGATLEKKAFPIMCVHLNRLRPNRGVKRSHSPDRVSGTDVQEIKQTLGQLLIMVQDRFNATDALLRSLERRGCPEHEHTEERHSVTMIAPTLKTESNTT